MIQTKPTLYLLGFICALYMLGVSWAQAHSNAYVITGVHVDVTDKNAGLAQQKAFKEGQVEAFKRLIQRLTRQSETEIEISDAQLSTFVQSHIVDKEKRSGVRYIADMTYRFDKAKVETFLSQQNIDFLPYDVKPLLILPIMASHQGRTLLWEEENTWLHTWAQVNPHTQTITFEIPEGNLQDIQDLSGEETLSLKAFLIEKLIRRYGAKGAVVVYYNPVESTAPEVKAWYLSPAGESYLIPLGASWDETTDMPSLISIVTEKIEEFISQYSSEEDASLNFINVTVHVKDQAEWLRTNRVLQKVFPIKGLKVESMSPKKIDVLIDFVGNVENLKKKLQQSDLNLESLENGDWVLMPDPS